MNSYFISISRAATSLEVAELPNFINIFLSAYQSESKQLSRFGHGLKHIYIARHGQQVYLTRKEFLHHYIFYI